MLHDRNKPPNFLQMKGNESTIERMVVIVIDNVRGWWLASDGARFAAQFSSVQAGMDASGYCSQSTHEAMASSLRRLTAGWWQVGGFIFVSAARNRQVSAQGEEELTC